MSLQQSVRRALSVLLLPALIACGAAETASTSVSPSATLAATAPAAAAPTDAPAASAAAPTGAPVTAPTPTFAPGSPEWYRHIEISPTLRLAGELPIFSFAVAQSDGLVVTLDSTGSPSSLSLVDVGDPARPRVRGSVDLGEDVRGLAVEGHMAWVAAGQRVQGFDLSDPDRPVARGTLAIPGCQGPAQAEARGPYPGPSQAPSCSVSWLRARGQYVYLTFSDPSRVPPSVKCQPAALAILDVGAPEQPRLLSRLPLEGCSQTGLELVGDTAYLINQAGFQIVDVGRPDAPRPLGSYASEWASALAVSGARVYLASNRGIEILDASDPLKPRLTGTYPVGPYGHFSDIHIAGGRLYLTEANLGSTDYGSLVVLDLHDPDRPVEIGRATAQANAYAVQTVGPLVAVAFAQRGLVLLQERPR